MEPKELLSLLEERLVQHDRNREEVQRELHEVCTKALGGADSLEETLNADIHSAFDKEEEEVLGVIAKLNAGEGEVEQLMGKAQEVLSREIKYYIRPYYSRDSYMDAYDFRISMTKRSKKEGDAEGSVESVVKLLEEHVERVQEMMRSAQGEVAEIYGKRRGDVMAFEERVNGELEPVFGEEDGRIQSVVKRLREKIGCGAAEEVEELASMARTVLVVTQRYGLAEPDAGRIFDKHSLRVRQEKSLRSLGLEGRKPRNVGASFGKDGRVSFSFELFSVQEEEVLRGFKVPVRAVFVAWERGCELTAKTFTKDYTLGEGQGFCFDGVFTPCAAYSLKMRVENDGVLSGWSEVAEFAAPEFKARCGWSAGAGYTVSCAGGDGEIPRVATKAGGYGHRAITGNTTLPPTAAISWDVKILDVEDAGEGGSDVYIGVAPWGVCGADGEYVHRRCGWYLGAFSTTLWSGPPHNYEGRAYGPRGLFRKTVHVGSSIRVAVNTGLGEVSFSVRGKSYGVAYSGVPLDRPLVPCVVLEARGDSVEIAAGRLEEVRVDASVGVPSNVTAVSRTWDSVDLKWERILGASQYQVEVDGCVFPESSAKREFRKGVLSPGTEHRFRVRAIRGASVGGWSSAAVARTLDAPAFTGCVWKECPAGVNEKYRYAVSEENPHVATMTGFGECTVVGTTPLPVAEGASWSVRVVKSRNNDNFGVWVGVLPFDVEQGECDNYKRAGWHFYCYSSTLWSGPPHNCYNEAYRRGGGAAEEEGKKFRILKGETTIAVTVDTADHALSFAANGVSMGIAFVGITLDKPLVPSVVLKRKGDSVELIL